MTDETLKSKIQRIIGGYEKALSEQRTAEIAAQKKGVRGERKKLAKRIEGLIGDVVMPVLDSCANEIRAMGYAVRIKASSVDDDRYGARGNYRLRVRMTTNRSKGIPTTTGLYSLCYVGDLDQNSIDIFESCGARDHRVESRSVNQLTPDTIRDDMTRFVQEIFRH